MITAAQLARGVMRASTANGVPLAMPAAQVALEAPAKNVSVTPMARCQSPVTLSQGSAGVDQEPRGRSVTAANTGMRVRARSVFFVEMNAPAFFSVTWLAWSRWP